MQTTARGIRLNRAMFNPVTKLMCFIVLSTKAYEIFAHVDSQYFLKGNHTTLCGNVLSVGSAGKLISCSEKCLLQATCRGFLFNQEAESLHKCKLVTAPERVRVNQTFIENNYVEYSVKPNNLLVCNNLGISIGTPANWQAGCPKLYFPLDSAAEGTAVGPDSSRISFMPGKINNSFYFPNPSGIYRAYFDLGQYPSTSYCFPDPERCIEGVTFAFWLNLLGIQAGKFQGFIATATENGPGFMMNWQGNTYDRLTIRIRRDSDTIREWIRLPRADFTSEYGFGTWVHYIITYKYDAESNENNVEVYFNGEVQVKVQKRVGAWSNPNLQDYNGNLQLGTYYVGSYDKNPGNMALDELIIWEEEFSCDDAVRLYQAYNG